MIVSETGANGIVALSGGSTTGLAKATALRTDLPRLKGLPKLYRHFNNIRVSRFCSEWRTIGPSGPVLSRPRAVWFAPIHVLPFIETLVLVLAAVMLGPASRIPAGTLLIPMFVGAVLQSNGLVDIELPRWLLTASYFLLGWTIGLRFTRAILVYAVS
jgi:hypothetical protein